MRGAYLIDRETTCGDRAIVATIDIEGLLSGQSPLRVAMERADEVLLTGGVYKVRIIHDRGDTMSTHASRVAGREWRGRKVAAMRDS